MPKKKAPGPVVQLALFEETVEALEASLAERDAQETGHLTPEGKRKTRRELSARQKWASEVFFKPHDELKDGVHRAQGCGCLMEIRGNLFFPMACDLHPGLEGALFELPQEQIEKAQWAAAEREIYYHLPIEPLSPEKEAELSTVGLPWDDSLGRPEDWKGKLFTVDYRCGCKFTAREITTHGKPDETRTGHYWFAIKVRSCGGETGGWCNFPNLAVDVTFGKKWGRN